MVVSVSAVAKACLMSCGTEMPDWEDMVGGGWLRGRVRVTGGWTGGAS